MAAPVERSLTSATRNSEKPSVVPRKDVTRASIEKPSAQAAAGAQPVNPEEEELPLYPQFAVQHLDEDEADNIWVADGHAIEVGVAEVHAADDD